MKNAASNGQIIAGFVAYRLFMVFSFWCSVITTMESLTDRNLIDGNARRRIFYRSLKIGFLSRDWLCFGNIKESFSKVFKNFSALTMP